MFLCILSMAVQTAGPIVIKDKKKEKRFTKNSINLIHGKKSP